MPLIESQRHLFDIPSEIAYFNCAYNSPQLNESRNRLQLGVLEKSHPWLRTSQSFFEDAETIRQLSSVIFGGDADGYAVIPSASYGLSTAARVLEPLLCSGDRILVMTEEFPSNVLPWKRTVHETNAVLKTIPIPQDGNWTQAILNTIDASDINLPLD
jgi:selenocysteine lyase/cysteine desulfurase